MRNVPTEVSGVIYDAKNKAITAQVTIRDGLVTRSYACSVSGPISMPYARTARELARRALRKHGESSGSAPAPAPQCETEPEPRRGLPVGQYGFYRGRTR